MSNLLDAAGVVEAAIRRALTDQRCEPTKIEEIIAALRAPLPEAGVREALEKTIAETRAILAGTDVGSLPHDWTLQQVAEARCEDITDLRWKVRDTCARAEKAEASLVPLGSKLLKVCTKSEEPK